MLTWLKRRICDWLGITEFRAKVEAYCEASERQREAYAAEFEAKLRASERDFGTGLQATVEQLNRTTHALVATQHRIRWHEQHSAVLGDSARKLEKKVKSEQAKAEMAANAKRVEEEQTIAKTGSDGG